MICDVRVSTGFAWVGLITNIKIIFKISSNLSLTLLIREIDFHAL